MTAVPADPLGVELASQVAPPDHAAALDFVDPGPLRTGRRQPREPLLGSLDPNGAGAAEHAGRPGGVLARRPRRHHRYQPLVAAVDVVAAVSSVVAGLAALSVVSSAGVNRIGRLLANSAHLLIFPPALVLAFLSYGLYSRPLRHLAPGIFHEVKDFVHGVFIAGFVSLGAGVGLHRLAGFPEQYPAQLAAVTLVAALLLPIGRALAARLVAALPDSETRVLLIGSSPVIAQLRRHLRRCSGVRLVGVVDSHSDAGQKHRETFAALPALCERLGVDRVLAHEGDLPSSGTLEALRRLQSQVPISIVPSFHQLLSWRSMVEDVGGVPIIDVAPPEITAVGRFAKRTLDVLGATLGLIAAAPVLLVAAIGIKLTSPGPILFRQTRSGRGERPFRILKLRTMELDAEARLAELRRASGKDTGGLFKLEHDPRTTRWGALLRRTSIDEIPQLVNVLAGHMSLVGPRPFVLEEASRLDGWAARRFEVRPGLTGLWQVSGRSDAGIEEVRDLDYVYVASWSFWWDLKILCQTPGAVLRRAGAY